MRLAIFWHDLLPYHHARIRALSTLGREREQCVQAFILCSSGLGQATDGEQASSEPIKILSADPYTAGEFSQRSKHQLLQELDKFQPDAVAIIGYTGPVSRAALGWCRYHRRGAILMLSSHAADYPRVWWKEWPKRHLVRLYDAAIVSGKPQAHYAAQLGLPQERIVAGYGVVDNEFWGNAAVETRRLADHWRTHYGLPEHFFLTACRFVPKKNLAGLLEAYASYVAQKSEKPWSLVMVGDGELAGALRQQVADLGLTNWVHFPGYLPAPQMARLYGLASAFVLASDHAEQWGLVVNEAMAAGLPVLVSQVCGCVADLVIEGKTGFSFDPTNKLALPTLLATFSSGSLDLAEMGRNSQLRIQHYSPQKFAHNLFTAAELAMQHASLRFWKAWPQPALWF